MQQRQWKREAIVGTSEETAKTTLFVNAAFREGSRTRQLAQCYLEGVSGNIVEVDIGSAAFPPLDAEGIKGYNAAVKGHDFAAAFFDAAHQFAAADEIVIAAPFWNDSIPAALHNYLEHVCSQGVTFDMDESGAYYSLCKARKLVFITTAGGYIPEGDHAFGYVASLARDFWNIPEVVCYQADGIDIIGNDKEAILQSVRDRMESDRAKEQQL